MRILIADDDPTAREIARHLVARAGHATEVVCDGSSALAAICQGQYDLAILDVQMPGLDGVEVARLARASLPDGACPRLVAFTAGATHADEGSLIALGFDACLPKPIRQGALSAILAGAEPPPPLVAASPPAAPASATPALAGVIALLSSSAAPFDALRSVAGSLKGDAIAAEQLTLAALCARLEAAAAARDRPAVTDLASAIVSMLG